MDISKYKKYMNEVWKMRIDDGIHHIYNVKDFDVIVATIWDVTADKTIEDFTLMIRDAPKMVKVITELQGRLKIARETMNYFKVYLENKGFPDDSDTQHMLDAIRRTEGKL